LPVEKLNEVLCNSSSQPKEQPNSHSNNQLTKCSYCQNIVYTGNTYSCTPCGTVYCSKNCCENSAPHCKRKLGEQNQPQNNQKTKNDIEVTKLLIQFFKSNNIKQITLDSEDNLIIEYEPKKQQQSIDN